MAMPHFLLVGAPKAGSTALHVALSRHPQLHLSRIKEPKYFLSDGEPVAATGPGDAKTSSEQIWRRRDYEALFDDAPPGALCGESTTLYLGDPAAHERIAAALPEVKLIAILRDPVDRAHSNWTHLFGAGLEPESDFLRACDLEPARLAAGWAPFWGYLNQGRYGEQLEHLFSCVDRSRVLVLMYRELRLEPAATLDRVTEFLGVQTGMIQEITPENVTAAVTPSVRNRLLGRALRTVSQLPVSPTARWHDVAGSSALRLLQREQRTRTPLTPEQHAELIPRFTSDIALLESVLDRSFAHWHSAGNAAARPALRPEGRFGTAYRSIDNPVT